MRIQTAVEEPVELCPEDYATTGWLEETSVYMSMAATEDVDRDEPPADS